MTKAIRIHKTGGAEVLQWEDVEVGKVGAGQARIRHTAVGLNFIDTYQRSGLYPLPLPSGIGLEAAIVEEVGEGVSHVKVGDRVACAGGPAGAYAQERVMPASPLVRPPKEISDIEAAAMLLQGLPAQYLVRRTYKPKPGEAVLLHAAADGVGLIVSQWLKSLCVTAIGAVGSETKAELASQHGPHHPIHQGKLCRARARDYGWEGCTGRLRFCWQEYVGRLA